MKILSATRYVWVLDLVVSLIAIGDTGNYFSEAKVDSIPLNWTNNVSHLQLEDTSCAIDVVTRQDDVEMAFSSSAIRATSTYHFIGSSPTQLVNPTSVMMEGTSLLNPTSVMIEGTSLVTPNSSLLPSSQSLSTAVYVTLAVVAISALGFCVCWRQRRGFQLENENINENRIMYCTPEPETQNPLTLVDSSSPEMVIVVPTSFFSHWQSFPIIGSPSTSANELVNEVFDYPSPRYVQEETIRKGPHYKDECVHNACTISWPNTAIPEWETGVSYPTPHQAMFDGSCFEEQMTLLVVERRFLCSDSGFDPTIESSTIQPLTFSLGII